MQRQVRKQFLLKIFYQHIVGERMTTINNLVQKVKDVVAPSKSRMQIDMKTLLFVNIKNGQVFHCSDGADLEDWIEKYRLTTLYCYVMNSKQQISELKQFGTLVNLTTITSIVGQKRQQQEFDNHTPQTMPSEMQPSSMKKQNQRVHNDAAREQQAEDSYQLKPFQVKPKQQPTQQYLNPKPTRPISHTKGKVLVSPSSPIYPTKDQNLIQHKPKPILMKPGKPLPAPSNQQPYDRVVTVPSNNEIRGYDKQRPVPEGKLSFNSRSTEQLKQEQLKQELQSYRPVEFNRVPPRVPLKLNEPVVAYRPPNEYYGEMPPRPPSTAVQPYRQPRIGANQQPINRPSSSRLPPHNYRNSKW